MTTLRFALLALACPAMAAPSAFADPITYSIVNDPTDQNGYTLIGTITTDGKIGTLSASDITAWSYALTNGATTFSAISTSSGASSSIQGNVIASAGSIVVQSAPAQSNAGNALQFFSGSQGSGTGAGLVWERYDDYDVNYGDYQQNIYQSYYKSNGVTFSHQFYTSTPSGFGAGNWTVATAAVPEPASMLMTAGGLALAGLIARRRRKANRV